MALDKLTLLDETIINNTATSVATTVVNNSAQTNYISFPVATASPTSNGWRVYKDTDTVAPTVGTGGSPNTTLTQNTDNPLNSTGDFRLTKTSSASRRGEGISTDFTIANRHLAKVLQISFDYELISGTLATDDIRVYIIQDPTGTPVVIEPVNVSIQGSLVSSPTIKLRHLATFQTHISVTSYRLCIHVASTSTSAYTVDFNNFRVWEPSQSIGSIITDWQSFTMTIGATTTAPTKATNAVESAKWRRVGSQMEIRYSYYHTSSTGAGAGSGDYLWSIPSGFSIDSSVVPNSTSSVQARSHVGEFIVSNGNDMSSGQVRAYDSTRLILRFNSGSPAGAVSSGAYNLASTSSMEYSFTAFVPIAGWGSNVVMSSDSGDGRVVAAKMITLAENESPRKVGNKFTFSRTEYDTHNGWSSANGEYTAPVSGFYACKYQIYAVNSASVVLYKDSTPVAPSYGIYTDGGFLNGSNSIYCNAGQKISIQSTQSAESSIASISFFAIERISAGSQIIASSETVVCDYSDNSGVQVTIGSFVGFNTRTSDSHGIVSGSNTTWQAVIPMSGVYNILAQYAQTQDPGTILECRIVIGGAERYTGYSAQESDYSGTCVATAIASAVRLNSGEVIQVRVGYNGTNSRTRTTSLPLSRFQLVRIGI